ncbi:hypothetical protein B0H10DRAFT_1944911 [Mycena sp. CBHHK59/15]|nr:hypothetical protein B0H10DRAFT_1944911 [Mycena sp. CBHHK59/15]
MVCGSDPDDSYSRYSWKNAIDALTSLNGGCFWTGLAAYMLLATCKEIVSNVTDLRDHLQFSFKLFNESDEAPEKFPQSLHSHLQGPSINDLDDIILCTLRFLLLLDPATTMPTIYWYICNRCSDNALKYAFEICDADILAAAVRIDVESRHQLSYDIVCGIATLILWYGQSFTRNIDCARILSMMEATQMQSHSDYLTAVSLLSSSILSSLYTDRCKTPGDNNCQKMNSCHTQFFTEFGQIQL